LDEEKNRSYFNGGFQMVFGTKKDVFFEKLLLIANNIEESAKYLIEVKVKNVSDLKEIATVMKSYESKGDTYIHELIVDLNKTFITPIEREDILQLAMKMDDVLDGMEQCVAYYEMFSFTAFDEYIEKFVSYIYKSTIEIRKAMELLSNKKLLDMRMHSIEIKDIESKCDELLRVSIKHLFAIQKDPIKIIQHKEIYEMLEKISDSSQDVANTIETIIMRNA
jgi:predicted phosphate transport protein (TIGR00153 family)